MAIATHMMWHCAYTRANFNGTGDHIRQWHMGPKKMSDGRIRYMGQYYGSVDELPDEEVGGKSIKTFFGNGWSRPGYQAIILRDGTREWLIEDDGDNEIDPWEITYGASGTNSFTRHFCMFGGLADNGKDPENNFTDAQWMAAANLTLEMITKFPNLKLIGHNQTDAHKSCPTFSVPRWAELLGIDPINIDYENLKNNPYFIQYHNS